MRTLRFTVLFGLSLFAAMAMLFIFPGCEDEPSSASDITDGYFEENPYESAERDEPNDILTILPETPQTIAYEGQQITFTIDGSSGPFYWEVSNEQYGTITESTANDRTALYTATVVAPNTITAYDKYGHSDNAYIDVESVDPFEIIPNTETFTSGFASTNAPGGVPTDLSGATVQFTATGGTEPYSNWKVSSANLGSISQSGLYTVRGNWGTGENTVSVEDSAGNLVTAHVITKFKDQ